VRGGPFPLLALAASYRRAAPLGSDAAVRRVDAGFAPAGERFAAGGDDGVVTVALVVRQAVVALPPVVGGKRAAAALAARLRP
jgi:hypothetical protein